MGGHYDHCRLRVPRVELIDKRQPIHARELQIRQHQVGDCRVRERLFRARRMIHFEPCGFQVKLYDAAQLVFIFYDQDTVCHC
jgi:hypothetical protein